MTWEIIWTGPAAKEMRRLDRSVAERARAAVRRLAESDAGDVQKLAGRAEQWRLKVGDVRVLFTRDFATRAIIVLHVLPRGRAYRDD